MASHQEMAELREKLELVLAFAAKVRHNFWVKVKKENPQNFSFLVLPLPLKHSTIITRKLI